MNPLWILGGLAAILAGAMSAADDIERKKPAEPKPEDDPELTPEELIDRLSDDYDITVSAPVEPEPPRYTKVADNPPTITDGVRIQDPEEK